MGFLGGIGEGSCTAGAAHTVQGRAAQARFIAADTRQVCVAAQVLRRRSCNTQGCAACAPCRRHVPGVCVALQVPWDQRRRLSLHGLMPGTSEAMLRGMLPVGAPDLEDMDYAGGRLGSLQFAHPEDADAAFVMLPV